MTIRYPVRTVKRVGGWPSAAALLTVLEFNQAQEAIAEGSREARSQIGSPISKGGECGHS